MHLFSRRRWSWLLHAGTWAALYLVRLPFFFNNAVSAPVLHNAASFALFIGLFYLNAYGLVNGFYERGRRGLYVLASGTAVWATAYLSRTLDAALFDGSLATAFMSPARYRAYTLGLCAAVAGVSFFYQVLRNRTAEQRRQQAIIARQNEAQLLYLRAQINPHFLFNTLNNLYALAVAQAPQTAETVLRLSNLLRFAIYSSRQALIPLTQELAHIRELLWLDGLRRETPAQVTLTVEGEVDGAWVEPMLLLPLVENCLKHGDLDLNPAAYLRLHLRATADAVVLRAENSYDPDNQAKDATPGVGLQNVRQRLALQHPGGAAGLYAAARPAQRCFVAELRLPRLTPGPAALSNTTAKATA